MFPDLNTRREGPPELRRPLSCVTRLEGSARTPGEIRDPTQNRTLLSSLGDDDVDREDASS